uniref:Uncharacterized protein n=1 Tax=Rhizophora mucronata TaxID=61149 RepID=A0A2P2IHY0_RHIMU
MEFHHFISSACKPIDCPSVVGGIMSGWIQAGATLLETAHQSPK